MLVWRRGTIPTKGLALSSRSVFILIAVAVVALIAGFLAFGGANMGN
jgi:hypothetical protein